MAIRLISDLHLDETRPETVRAFFRYMDELPDDTESLYILGDFFEIWKGDDDDDPFIHRIKAKLKEKTASGLPIFFMHGNRDFLIGKGFELQTGCILIPDLHFIEHNNETYLVMHGDTLCIDDQQYQKFRQMVRSVEWQTQFLGKSLQERREEVKKLRENSQKINQSKDYEIMDVNQGEVERVMHENKIKTLIHGHTHRPAIHELPNGLKRIVLGDWHDKGWEVVISNAGVELIDFSIEQS